MPKGTISQDAPNTRLQLAAFGARDRGFFEVILCSAPWRQLKRNTLDGELEMLFASTKLQKDGIMLRLPARQ